MLNRILHLCLLTSLLAHAASKNPPACEGLLDPQARLAWAESEVLRAMARVPQEGIRDLDEEGLHAARLLGHEGGIREAKFLVQINNLKDAKGEYLLNEKSRSALNILIETIMSLRPLAEDMNKAFAESARANSAETLLSEFEPEMQNALREFAEDIDLSFGDLLEDPHAQKDLLSLDPRARRAVYQLIWETNLEARLSILKFAPDVVDRPYVEIAVILAAMERREIAPNRFFTSLISAGAPEKDRPTQFSFVVALDKDFKENVAVKNLRSDILMGALHSVGQDYVKDLHFSSVGAQSYAPVDLPTLRIFHATLDHTEAEGAKALEVLQQRIEQTPLFEIFGMAWEYSTQRYDYEGQTIIVFDPDTQKAWAYTSKLDKAKR